jgi:hypothetical protein
MNTMASGAELGFIYYRFQVPPPGSEDYFANYQAYVCGNGVAQSAGFSAGNVNSVLSGYAANLVGINSGSVSYEAPQDLPALTVDAVKKRLTDR